MQSTIQEKTRQRPYLAHTRYFTPLSFNLFRANIFSYSKSTGYTGHSATTIVRRRLRSITTVQANNPNDATIAPHAAPNINGVKIFKK
ncbi:hypothetical protein QJS04_geneDACA011403 [Acorus gramineus]|uniref:Uncharacterized protein n=1 Tax=Acorus gramineus TaxID=55184 RepID=A0AAV9AJK8_ACOGR|nr:hypothetical protein QJS04_geneDACA011403 [Acorus gramineus]